MFLLFAYYVAAEKKKKVSRGTLKQGNLLFQEVQFWGLCLLVFF